VSVATIQGPAAIYREEQFFGWWVYALIGLIVLLGLLGITRGAPMTDSTLAGQIRRIETPLVVIVGFAMPALLVFGVLKLTIEVTPSECRVWFGWIPTYSQVISLDQIQSVEPIQYRPLTDCGGWGIRTSREGERVLNARGELAVRITLNDGSRILLGTQRPDELAAALRNRC
jgi:hypothetical protein